jgi:hypothetical protein
MYIEVTPAIIDAGAAVYREWAESAKWDYRRFLSRLSVAMFLAQCTETGARNQRKRTRR